MASKCFDPLWIIFRENTYNLFTKRE